MVIFKRGLGCLEYNLKRNIQPFTVEDLLCFYWLVSGFVLVFCFGFLGVFLVVF